MTETEFRCMHSEFVEYCQYIENRINGICAAILAENYDEWCSRLGEHQENTFGRRIYRFRKLQEEKQENWLTDADFEKLDKLRVARNFWVHECFWDPYWLVFTRRNGTKEAIVKNPQYAAKLKQDFGDAVEWDKRLTDVFSAINVLNKGTKNTGL